MKVSISHYSKWSEEPLFALYPFHPVLASVHWIYVVMQQPVSARRRVQGVQVGPGSCSGVGGSRAHDAARASPSPTTYPPWGWGCRLWISIARGASEPAPWCQIDNFFLFIRASPYFTAVLNPWKRSNFHIILWRNNCCGNVKFYVGSNINIL